MTTNIQLTKHMIGEITDFINLQTEQVIEITAYILSLELPEGFTLQDKYIENSFTYVWISDHLDKIFKLWKEI